MSGPSNGDAISTGLTGIGTVVTSHSRDDPMKHARHQPDWLVPLVLFAGLVVELQLVLVGALLLALEGHCP